MKTQIGLCAALALILILSPSAYCEVERHSLGDKTSSTELNSKPIVVRSSFFILKISNGKAVYMLTKKPIPVLNIGAVIGCREEFNNPASVPIDFVAELRGPASLEHFHPNAHRVSFSDDRLSVFALTQISSDESDHGFWYSIDPGDPLGDYTLNCYLNNVLADSWTFTVE
jgi:hypothetical protein